MTNKTPVVTRLKVKILDQNNPRIVMGSITEDTIYLKCKDFKESYFVKFYENCKEGETCPPSRHRLLCVINFQNRP